MTEQLPGREHDMACECEHCPEQPNQKLMIIKTIQGLMEVVKDNLSKLDLLTELAPIDKMKERKTLIAQALEDIDLFEKTTLFELQKACE